MTWAVLDSAVPHERDEWHRLWRLWPSREVAAHPAYVSLFAQQGERSLCATWTSPGLNVLFPFVLRPIGSLPWASGIDGWDLESPYGYGGAFFFGDPSAGGHSFWSAFEQWALGIGVVAAFARLSLFSNEILLPPWGEVVPVQKNIVRDLSLDDDELLRDYEHKVRKNIKKAMRCGVSVEIDPSGTRLSEFFAIYTSTMDRRAAADRYYYDQTFFERIRSNLRGQFIFAHAIHGDRVISTELVLLSATHAYSYLGGTLSDAFDLRPNDLLKHEICRWTSALGLSHYVLGGGYESNDGIYRYKKSFAPEGERDFAVWRHLVDPNAARDAWAARRDYEAGSGEANWSPREGFFPPYRG